MVTSRKSTRQTCLTATSLLAVHPVKASVLPENERDYVERKVACSMNSSGLYEKNNLALYSSRMLREFLAATGDGISPGFSLNWKMQGMYASGIYSTQRHTCRKTESACSLSDILQPIEEIDPKYFLSGKALKGLMKGQSKPQLIQSPQEDTVEDITVR